MDLNIVGRLGRRCLWLALIGRRLVNACCHVACRVLHRSRCPTATSSRWWVLSGFEVALIRLLLDRACPLCDMQLYESVPAFKLVDRLFGRLGRGFFLLRLYRNRSTATYLHSPHHFLPCLTCTTEKIHTTDSSSRGPWELDKMELTSACGSAIRSNLGSIRRSRIALLYLCYHDRSSISSAERQHLNPHSV